jgi:hypothetical protein
VLLRSDMFKCDLIVQQRVLLTIYPSKKFSSLQHYSEQVQSPRLLEMVRDGKLGASNVPAAADRSGKVRE